jgi:hypothetical protein
MLEQIMSMTPPPDERTPGSARVRDLVRSRVLPALAGVALVGFVGAMAAGAVALPHQSRSTMDGRSLRGFPDASASSVEDGTWMTGVESWLDDHVPARDRWLELHGTLASRALRAPVVDDVLVDDPQGMQLEKPVELTLPDALGANAQQLGRDVRAAGAPILWVYVPRKEESFADRLPAAWPDYYLRTAPLMKAAMRRGGPLLDLTPLLSDPQHRDDYYWRTDHHWTPAGALAAVDAIAARAGQLGVTIPPDVRPYTTHHYGEYLGSTGRRVTRGATKRPDQFDIPQPSSWRARGCRAGVCDQPVFVTSKATDRDPYANRYLAFTGGDHGYQRISNPDPAARGTIMLVKDSFGDALTTYLAERVSTLITIDERHYTGADLRKVVAAQKPDLVIVMHNQVSVLGNVQFDSTAWVDMAATKAHRAQAAEGDG